MRMAIIFWRWQFDSYKLNFSPLSLIHVAPIEANQTRPVWELTARIGWSANTPHSKMYGTRNFWRIENRFTDPAPERITSFSKFGRTQLSRSARPVLKNDNRPKLSVIFHDSYWEKRQQGSHDIIIDHKTFEQGFKLSPAPNCSTPPRENSDALPWAGGFGTMDENHAQSSEFSFLCYSSVTPE